MKLAFGNLVRALPAVFCCAVLAARADAPDDEQKAFKAAQQFYKEGAFELADDRLAALLKKDPKSELLPQAELLEAQALYQLGKSDAAFAAFTLPLEQVPENLRSDTAFWQAEALLDQGRWPEAEQKYRALLALKNAPARADAGDLGLAWALFKEGNENDAMTLIQGLIKENPNGAAAQQAQLLLAKIALAQGQSTQAITELEALLATKPEPSVAFPADYWLGEAYAATGDFNRAADAYQEVTGVLPGNGEPLVPSQAFPKTLVAQAYIGLGRAEHALHQDDQAMLAYGQAFALTENAAAQMESPSCRNSHRPPRPRRRRRCSRSARPWPRTGRTTRQSACSNRCSSPTARARPCPRPMSNSDCFMRGRAKFHKRQRRCRPAWTRTRSRSCSAPPALSSARCC